MSKVENSMDAMAGDDRENDLLLRLRSGDERAFEEFYGFYGRRIFGNIFKMVKDKEVSSELLQDVFIKVWEKRQLIDLDKSFRSYLFTISRNVVYNYFQRTSLEKQIEAYLSVTRSELYTHIEEDFFHHEAEGALHDAIAKLPAQRQKIYLLCKIEGKSYEEVGSLLGVSVSTVNDHIVKATRFLREQMGNSGYLGILSYAIASFDLLG